MGSPLDKVSALNVAFEPFNREDKCQLDMRLTVRRDNKTGSWRNYRKIYTIDNVKECIEQAIPPKDLQMAQALYSILMNADLDFEDTRALVIGRNDELGFDYEAEFSLFFGNFDAFC